MKTLGSHPGAILFRLSVMVIIIAILMVVFFRHVDDAQVELERQSILQTKRVIDSSLAVVFASYAAKGHLHRLNELNGGNPFEILREFNITAPGYVGAIDTDLDESSASGWYYLSHRRQVVYKSHFAGADSYFAVVLHFDDVDASGSFDPRLDRFRHLQFVALNGD